MALERSDAGPGSHARPEFRYVQLPAEDFRLELSARDVPFLSAMSRMGVAFAIFFGLLALASLPFVRTAELVVVDLMAVAASALLLACSTIGIRIAVGILNRSLGRETKP
jgi:hypothetical protein